MKRTGLSVTVALLMVSVTLAGVLPAGAKNLTAEIEVPEDVSWVDADQGVMLRFTLANSGEESIFVLRWQTPVAGIEHPIFVVTRDGEPVPYVGKMVKRAAPTPADFVEIAPGDALSVWFDPTSAYEMSVTGSYSLQYRADLQVMSVDTGKADPPAGFSLESNAVDLWVEGYDKPREYELDTSLEKSLSYSNCSSSQQSTVSTAFNYAITLSSNALSDLNNSNACYYTKWFGTYTSSRYNTVTSNYSAILSAFQNQSVVVDCGCTDSAYAYVYKNQPYKIYVCNAFWSAPTVGYDSKAGTLLHEMSHFTVVADTDDHVYGQSGCQSLAQSNPSQAIDNADSHEYNAENTYVTPCSTGSTELDNGVPETNLSAAKNATLDFTMAVPSGAQNLSFVTSGGSGDADLYVKFGSAPTTSSYDCRSWNSSNNESCSFASPSTGTYYVMINAYQAFSGLSLTGSYDTGGTPPNANFTFTTNGLTASFTDTSSDSDGSISSRSWNFGDSTTSSSTNPSHTYGSGGTYTVTLTVTDNDGLTDSVQKSVTVSDPGGAPCTGCDHYTGSLSGTGDKDYHPNGTYYYASSGTHEGWLEGPSSADFDLYLYRWNGSSWSQVGSSTSGSSSEHISSYGSSGYYYWRVYSYSGSGSYDLWLDTP